MLPRSNGTVIGESGLEAMLRPMVRNGVSQVPGRHNFSANPANTVVESIKESSSASTLLSPLSMMSFSSPPPATSSFSPSTVHPSMVVPSARRVATTEQHRFFRSIAVSAVNNGEGSSPKK